LSATILAVIVDCREPRRQADFWASVLSYDVTERNRDEFKVSDPKGQGGALYFMRVPEAKVVKNRLHIDLVTEGSMEDEVERLTSLGGRVIEVRKDPDSLENPDTWTVMEDPEGNEFCVSSWTTITDWD
jgi:hypothetical protein